MKGIFNNSGPWVVAKLKAAGYTQASIGKELDIHFQQVSNWARGLAKVPPKHIIQIAEMISTNEIDVVYNKQKIIELILKDEAERIGVYTKRPLQDTRPELFS